MRGFREIREIKIPEKISSDPAANHESENFRKIKPQTEITTEEARAFIDSLFESMKEIEGSN